MSRKTQTTAVKEEAKPALVPKLRFPEFREMQGWDIEAVGDLVAESRTPSLLNDPSKRITVRLHLQGVEHREHRGTESTESTNNFSRKAGQFIYGKQNIHKGAFGIIPDQLDGFETSQDLPCFDFKRRCCPRWFYFNFASEAVYGPLELKMTGTGSKRLNEKTFLSLPIAVPSPAEQQKIAECLSSVDEVIAAQARKLDALKTHKKGLMQQLFPREGETQPRLRFPEFQNAGEWEERKLGTVCDIQRGKFSHRPRNDPRFFGGPYPFIQTGDVVKSEGGAVIASQSLNEEGLAVSKLFKPTIVLITIAANIGDTGLLMTEGCFTDSVVGLIPNKHVIPAFLELVMRGQKENLNKVATTGAQKNINNEILREVSVLLPPVPEQHRIATCLSSLDALIAAETQKHAALQRHKRGLMQQLFPTPTQSAI